MYGVDQIVSQIVKLILLLVVGFIAGKTKYLPENTGNYLSKVVIKVTVPFLILFTLAGRSFTIHELINGLWIYVIGIVFILMAYMLSLISLRFLKLKEEVGSIYKMHFMFGNVIFMAYPLLFALYGQKGIAYSVFFNLANDTLLWTIGIYLVNKHKNISIKENMKHWINANTISFGVGLVLMLLHFKDWVDKIYPLKVVYTILYDAYYPLGETTIYLSMLFIGLILSEIKLSDVIKMLGKTRIYLLICTKLLILPTIAMVALPYFVPFLDKMAKEVIILQLAMPCATIVPALALEHGADYLSATENVFVTTILSIFTLPLIVFLLGT